ncbi:MAG: DUF3568 domain-containing protein [Syntrophales bacterium LBB04]|nr:DUF3568 domain-containing protein [Syntrophales bacterium LBB04]
MRGNRVLVSLGVTFCLLTSGCEVLMVGGAAMGTSSGTYLYLNGEVNGEYNFPLEAVWAACEKTMTDMHAVNVEKTRKIGSGDISATINEKPVTLKVKYEGRDKTSLGVRVGLFGDETASKFLYDKIRDNISRH